MKIVDATSVDDADLCAGMAAAFSDYAVPMNLPLPGFIFMMKQRGLSRSASRIAVVDDKVVAIWLVSVRGNASYLIASGTIPEYRGKGLATRLANAALDSLRDAAISTFQTEVLVENTKAANLYFRLGMHKHRHLACHTVTGPRQGTTEIPVEEVDWSDIAEVSKSMKDWPASWQNSDHAIAAIADDVDCFCVRDRSGPIGYAVIAPQNASLLQIGVHPDARRKGIGTALINRAVKATTDGRLRIINIDASDAGFARFLKSFPGQDMQGQFELMMQL